MCVRLYSEDDFAGRPEFTDPEILRTNLAAVILQMTALGLGDIASFPFVESPDRRNLKDGLALLQELGAIEQPTGLPKLTAVGRKLAALPVDPRIARMIVHADTCGFVREAIVIDAARETRTRIRHVHVLENQADSLYHGALAQIFESPKDPIELMKWKEILETIEDATDRIERVAQSVGSTVMRNA